MRDLSEQKQLETAIKKSRKSQEQLILETENKREYFRLQDDEIVEYDLTKCNSKQVKLKDEEKQGIAEFDFSRSRFMMRV